MLFNDVVYGVQRPLMSSVLFDVSHNCSISILMKKADHLFLKLFICDSFLWQPVMFFWVRQGLEIKMLLLREVLSVCMRRQTHQSDG